MQLPKSFSSPGSKKFKELTLKKHQLNFVEPLESSWNVLALRLKNVLYILKKSFFYLPGDRTFQEMKLPSLISFLYFRKELSKLEKIKIITLKFFFLYFGKWNFLAPRLKRFLYFKREFVKPKSKKSKISYIFTFFCC